MVNQLIQKQGKKPITKPELVIVRDNTTSLERRLQAGFEKSQFDKGLKAFTGLKKEQEALMPLVVNRDLGGSLINLERVKSLTESLYLQGLTLLLQTLDISQQVGATNATALELENKELREELERNTTSTLQAMIEERLAKNIKSLKLVKSHRDRLDEIFCQVGLCKDSIREIRLELPELVAHKPKDELDKTLLELRTRIEFAQRVQDEYKRQGL
jgi:hypothetical protein